MYEPKIGHKGGTMLCILLLFLLLLLYLHVSYYNATVRQVMYWTAAPPDE